MDKATAFNYVQRKLAHILYDSAPCTQKTRDKIDWNAAGFLVENYGDHLIECIVKYDENIFTYDSFEREFGINVFYMYQSYITNGFAFERLKEETDLFDTYIAGEGTTSAGHRYFFS